MTDWADNNQWDPDDDEDQYAELIAEQRAAREAEEARLVARDAELHGMQILADGRIIWVDPDTRRVEWLTCCWLVQVASGNPEPDSLSDCYKEIECGSIVTALVRPGKPLSTDHTTCEGGHDRHSYGSHEQQYEEMESEFNDQRNAR